MVDCGWWPATGDALTTLAKKGIISVTAERGPNEGTRPFNHRYLCDCSSRFLLCKTLFRVQHHQHQEQMTSSIPCASFPYHPLPLLLWNNPLNITLSSGSFLATILGMILPSRLL
jgi:hypothetical protein